MADASYDARREVQLRGATRARIHRLLGATRFESIAILLLVAYVALALLFSVVYWSLDLVDGSLGFVDHFYFSVVTQTTLGYGDLHPRGTTLAQLVASTHVTAALFMFAFTGAVLFFKFLDPPRGVIRFDPVAVFYPEEGMLRVRVFNAYPSRLIQVQIQFHLHTWLDAPPQPRFATYNVPARRSVIPVLEYRQPWNLTTKPLSAGIQSTLDHDRARVIEFGPNLMADPRTELIVTLDGQIDAIKQPFTEAYVYRAHEVVCGAYRFVDPEGLGHGRWKELAWQNWGKVDLSDTATRCPQCQYVNRCVLAPRVLVGVSGVAQTEQ